MSMAAEDSAQQVFIKYASIGKKGITLANATLDGAKFAKLCRESKLVGGALTPMDVEGIYLRLSKGFGRLDYEHFIKALDEIAAIKKVSVDAIFNKLAEADPLSGVSRPSLVRQHDDKRGYTGVHRAGGPRLSGAY
ncbi:hypothetical protein PLESTB_001313500 [Pleodorina starrii]|uniref:Uncharacterized protein n=1 Tax=Pleodorina starrii TaxID=330485 RepID=A0A9W6BUD4_9CHLO|nr:hypothetical protein PLESTM_001768900 [Pleodorina starrii]GLC58055.1 hypothetical protein PLESTB_001313500 [Pleodorina starrii]GLC66747.1 hypothetical protein PLESTF_000470100 [Pleodorina starrii]